MLKLSFVIPMYNAEKYIERCIDSVYHQGLNIKDFEVLIINDGSTDNSPALVKDMETYLSNLSIINKKNGGQGSARNLGIEMASGDYIMFIDADDYLIDYQIKSCLEKTIDNNLDVCCMRIRRLLPSGEPADIPIKKYKFSDEKVYTGPWLLLHNYFPASVCAHFFKRNFLLKSNIRFLTNIMHEDVDFQLKLFSYIQRFMFCHIFVYTYYYNPESTDRLMDINKQKHSMLSDMQICRDLIDFSFKDHVNNELKLFYVKISNSLLIGLCLNLVRNKALDQNFKKLFISNAYIQHLLPLKGTCFSWKTNILKPIINIFAYIYDRFFK
ncbi:glycosyltransferase family 2 protein [Prevotella intermedia]|uniref:glycosyltransferase family 2 protein n=1 Tax=Prevotella intermedia TaxID=28131 RepID=UPI000BE74C09|nr:glycosyltransferase [Prevotella intermedia]PDP81667.1 glycosyl transferase [Prevotella intermedia]